VNIQPAKLRRVAVERYCARKRYLARIIPLSDTYGKTLNASASYDAIVVTAASRKGARNINRMRAKKGLSGLPVLECPLVFDMDSIAPINATRIRMGIINREGFVFRNLFSTTLYPNAYARRYFGKSQGTLLFQNALLHDASTKNKIVAVVGDRTLAFFLQKKIPFLLGVYDGLSRRKTFASIDRSVKPDYRVSNPRGAITPGMVRVLRRGIREAEKGKKRFLKIDGEEDLAAVALVLIMPLQSIVYYGQPGQGIVRMVVTEKRKEKFSEMLRSV